MRLLRRARNTRILADYRQAAQAVIEKRKARLLSEPVSGIGVLTFALWFAYIRCIS